MVLFCTPTQWAIALLAGLIVSALAWPWYKEVSYAIAPVLLLMVVTMFHMVFASRFLAPFPHIAILIAGLQYVLAAWVSFYFPPTNPSYDIGARLPVYLRFGAGATIAFAFGWAAALQGARGCPRQASSVSPELLGELDALLWFGLACGLLGKFLDVPGIGFLLLLCANLRYVGAFGRMLVAGEGWQWRVGLVLANEVLLSAMGAKFHVLLLWCLSGFAVYLYRFQPKKRVVAACLVLGIVALPALQEAKWKIRQVVWEGESNESPGDYQSVAEQDVRIGWRLIGYLAEGLYRSAMLNWEDDFLADTATRYNQGWIINRVMQFVPAEEPYAKGETLVTAAKASVMPRVLAPGKYLAGGKLHMARFAGTQLSGDTSMNLGFAGEFYANFGYRGGITACFVYALCLGLMFRWVLNRSSRSPLWWAFVPYVGSNTFKAEDGIAEILNWIVKATLVAVVVYKFFPTIRATLSVRPETQRWRASRIRPGPGRSGRFGAGAAVSSSPPPAPPPCARR
jgi:hypothetical protein